MTNQMYPCQDCYIEPVDKPKGICPACRKKFDAHIQKLDEALHNLDNGYL